MMLVLSPMQDVTDAAFLRVLHRLGCAPDAVVTPYLRSTRTTCAMSEGPLLCIAENPPGFPIWAQLAGSDPEPLVRDARHLMAHYPICGINLNAGCPSPLVNRHGAGAALLRDLPRLRAVCLALREALPPGTFSIKCRLGWESAQEFPAILDTLAEAQPDWVGVHGRTRRQLYAGVPQAEAMALAPQRLSCPVLANGDLWSCAEAEACCAAVQPAGLMLGRGAVRNPYLFRELRGGSAPTRAEKREYLHRLIEETGHALKIYTEAGHCNRMKKYLAFCYDLFTPQAEPRLRRCRELAELRATIDQELL